MHTYRAEIVWEDPEGLFPSGKYSRAHTWSFDGGITVEASASPSVVRLPFSKEDAVDPEEAFVASVSSCHMLTFLYIAHTEGLIVKSYRDAAVGTMAKDDSGREWISNILLNPEIGFAGRYPTERELAVLHERAHRDCYIANSIRSSVEIGTT